MMKIEHLFKLTGLTGGVILGLCLFPQVYKTYRTKSTKDISYSWTFLYGFGMFMMLLYGLYFQLWPAFIPGVIEFLMILILIFLKYKYEKEIRNDYGSLSDFPVL